MPTLDDEIDQLYQGPAGEFTAARNALAKRAGDRAKEVRALEKPNAPAWAINHLYWHARPVFRALVKASEDLRDAHARRIRGQKADITAADARHRAALGGALAAATSALVETGGPGNAASRATTALIHQTLAAVPSPGIRGRLSRPVEVAGFSALADLIAHGPSDRGPAEIVGIDRGRRRGTGPHPGAATGRSPSPEKTTVAEARGEVEAARKAADARRQARTTAERELRTAIARERKANASLIDARRAAQRTDQSIDRLERELHDARAAAAEHLAEIDAARNALNDAAAMRVQLERRVRDLTD